MTGILTQKLASAIPSIGATLAAALIRISDEIGLGAAILLTVTGIALHWHLPRHRMSMEERMKDGKMTEEEADRQVRFISWCAPLTTMVGVIMLVVVLYDLTG